MKHDKKVKRTEFDERLRKDNKKKLKPLPNKPIPLGVGPFVGRHTTG
jgi:hypothetical protein